MAEILGDGLLVYWNTPLDVEAGAGLGFGISVAGLRKPMGRASIDYILDIDYID